MKTPLNRRRLGMGAFLIDFLAFSTRRTLATCLIVAAGASIEGLGITLVIPLLHAVSLTRPASDAIASVGLQSELLAWIQSLTGLSPIGTIIAAFAVAMLVRSWTGLWREVAIMRTEVAYTTHCQMRLIHRLAAAPWAKLARVKHARVTQVTTNDINAVSLATYGLLQSISAGISLVVQIAIAFSLAPLLAAIALCLLVLGVIVTLPLNRRARELGETLSSTNLGLIDDMTQFMGALKVAKSRNAQREFVKGFENGRDVAAQSEIEFVRQRGRTRAKIATAGTLVGGCFAYLGLGPLSINPAILLTFLLIISRMAGPITQLQAHALDLFRSVSSFNNIALLEAELYSEPGVDAEVRRSAGFSTIEFQHVAFRHHIADGETAAGIEDLSLTISVGEFLGVIGTSGAGKTTFADLLVGLYSPDSGSISLDGTSVDLSRMPSWRDGISYVPQDPFLRHDTVRANLLWASQGATEEQIDKALARAGALDLVRRLPYGIDSVVGERGALLSGGERQRLALAQAFLRNPRLLILDEATNAIDLTSERAILADIALARDSSTTVIIAHRRESLRFCSRVIILDHGHIVKNGDSGDIRRIIQQSDPSDLLDQYPGLSGTLG